MLSIKNLKQKRPSKKLLYKLLGLFTILTFIKLQTYYLALPNKYLKLYLMFYILLLELYYG